MTQLPAFSFIPILGHEIHVTEWGDRASPPLVMWHGLARSGRDFDELARALAQEYFIICPDTIGRGLSSWSSAPEAEYTVPHYAQIALGLLDHYGIERAAWLGTSMGGLIGMGLAGGGFAHRLSCLIINDIGPEVPRAALERILAYASERPRFATYREGEAWLRAAYAPFGPAPEGFWRRMTRTSLRRLEDGALSLHYDPAIIGQFAAPAEDLDLWELYESIDLPFHVVRGADSDVLPAPVLERMGQTGPCPGATIIEGCGHAPTLARPEDAQRMGAVLKALSGKGTASS